MKHDRTGTRHPESGCLFGAQGRRPVLENSFHVEVGMDEPIEESPGRILRSARIWLPTDRFNRRGEHGA